jgi:hypothetical protein
MHSSQYHYL